MKEIPKHFSLVAEHPQSYEIHDARDDKRFHVAKSAIDLGMHGKLSKIKKFAEGGEAKDSKGSKDGPTVGSIIGYPGSPPLPKPKNYAAGGSTPEPNSTSVPSPFDPDSLSQPAPAPMSFAHKAGDVIGTSIGDAYTAMGDVLGGAAHAVAAPTKDFIHGLVGDPAPASNAPDMPDQAQPGAISASPEMASHAAPGSGQAIQAQDPMLQHPLAANAALDAEKKSIQAGVSAEGQAGRDTATAYGQLSNQLDKMLTPQQIMANHKDADDALMKAYMNKSVDPDHYWNSKGTGSKISAGIGMVLGGLGAGLAGGPNYAVESINKAIDRDIDAQKNDQSKSMNLWKMNREATQNDMQATLATQNQLLLGTKAKALQYAAQASGPEARMRMAPMIQEIDQKLENNNFRRSMLSAADQGGVIKTDPSMLVSMLPEKDQPQAMKEIANAQEIKKLKDDFQNSFNDLNGRFMAGALSPSDRDSAINAFAGRIAKLSEGRFNLEEAKLQAQALLPGKFEGSSTRSNKQDRLDRFFDSMVTAPVFKGGTGVDLNRFASTNVSSARGGGSPQAQVQTMNGVPYVRVPGGWKRAQ